MKLSIICSSVFFFLIGCSTTVSSSSLASSKWQVDRIIVGDSVITIDGSEHPTLSFTADSTFGGQTTCNSMEGTYSTSQSGRIAMSIESITTTFCPENTIEGFLIEQISQTHYFTMTDDSLLFKDADGRTLIKLSPSVGRK